MRITAAGPDFRQAIGGDLKLLEGVHTGAMRDLVDGFKEELRQDIEAAGLGPRLAKTWRGRVYPGGGESLSPGGYVWSKAPKIVGAFAHGASIVPLDGRRYLALPTENVPRKGRGRAMTPKEVEVAFAQPLVVRRGRRGALLGFIKAIAAKNKRGFRKATPGRASQGRAAKLVLMFTFVRGVTLRKRLDPDAAFGRWAGRFDALAQSRWDASGLGR